MVDVAGGAPQTRGKTKAAGAFRTISEVATALEVPQHVLRFWESKFTQVKPLKRGGGRRYYRPEDVDLLRGIRHLLYSDGYTIKGVQKLMRDIGSKMIMESGRNLSSHGTIGAAGVAAARTRRQSGAPERQADAQGADQAAPGRDQGDLLKGADGGAAGTHSGLTSGQRGKLSDLAAELGEIQQILRRLTTKS
ncbi:MAG: MerR family transcriptional regulator [Alphaproteobacteria bacterium]|nr:MerR family transcriptional regulator [Alphaproteobacteria bacterium]